MEKRKKKGDKKKCEEKIIKKGKKINQREVWREGRRENKIKMGEKKSL